MSLEMMTTSAGRATAGKAVRPWSSGAVYMNALSEDEGARAVRDAYGPNYARLATLKAKIDPKNLFRLNPNIAPSV